MKTTKNLLYSDLSGEIISAAIAVHKELGPGLLESAYQACLACEFRQQDITFTAQRPLPVVYRGIALDCGYRLDFVVEEKIIVEIKSVKSLQPIHKAQTLSYLKLSDRRLGLLINFNVELLKHGVRRLIH